MGNPALTLSHRSGGRLAPYTSSDVARFTNMLLSLWLSPWGKLVDLEVSIPSVPLLSLKGIQLAVFTAQGIVAVRARSTWADPFAKPLAVRAALLTEVARLTFRAHVHGGKPRRACRYEHLRRDGVAPAPCCLTAGCAAEALPPNGFEGSAAPGAADRLAFVTQRLHPDLAGGCAVAVRVCGGSGRTRSRFR